MGKILYTCKQTWYLCNWPAELTWGTVWRNLSNRHVDGNSSQLSTRFLFEAQMISQSLWFMFKTVSCNKKAPIFPSSTEPHGVAASTRAPIIPWPLAPVLRSGHVHIVRLAVGQVVLLPRHPGLRHIFASADGTRGPAPGPGDISKRCSAEGLSSWSPTLGYEDTWCRSLYHGKNV